MTILVVDDEALALNGVRRTLRSAGFESVLTCGDSREVLPLLQREAVALLLLDLVMPHLGGEEILAEVSTRYPELPVVVITAEQDVRAAVRCMKLGAVDYLLKPVDAEDLVATVRRTLEHEALRTENALLRERFFQGSVRRPATFASIVTADPGMARVFSYVEAVAPGSQPVLILGESGTGKELIARALHEASERSGPFVAVNVAGLDDAMFSDTLFGHRAGAFTGASGPRKGMIEMAGSGTLFLDEIGDLGEASQVKLLRLLQEREYLPLGGDQPRPLNARVVAATHRDPTRLREDLYYRLRSYRLSLPPLRERPGDVPLLLERFVGAAAADLGVPPPTVPREALDLLGRHRFPGNVRELQALVFDAVARGSGGVLSVEALAEATGESVPPATPRAPEPPPAGAPHRRILREEEWKRLERENIEAALAAAGGKIYGEGGAAALLGLKPTTLVSRMKSLGMER